MATLTRFFIDFASCRTTEAVLNQCLAMLAIATNKDEKFIQACARQGFDMGIGVEVEANPVPGESISLIVADQVNFLKGRFIQQFWVWLLTSAYLLDNKKPISFANYIKIIHDRLPDFIDHLVDFFNWVEWDSFHLFASADRQIVEMLQEFKPAPKIKVFAFQKVDDDEDIDADEVHPYADKTDSEDEEEEIDVNEE